VNNFEHTLFEEMRALVVLIVCIFAVLVHCQPQRPGDCYQIEAVNECVGTNPPPNLPMKTVSVNCLWCHSHHNGTKARSHCAPLQHIQTNPGYRNGWVCDYRMPRSRHHAMVGHGHERIYTATPRDHRGNHHNHKPNNIGHHNKHGRHLLDVYTSSGLANQLEMAVNGYGPFGQFVSALIYGAAGNIPVDLANCLANSALTIEGLNTTAHSLTWNTDVANSVNNVAALYNSVQQTLFDAIGDCARVGFDVSEIVLPVATVALAITKDVMAIVNQDPSGIVGLIGEGIEITKALTAPNIEQDTTNAINSLQSGQVFNAGLQFGHAIFTILTTI